MCIRNYALGLALYAIMRLCLLVVSLSVALQMRGDLPHSVLEVGSHLVIDSVSFSCPHVVLCSIRHHDSCY